VIAALLLAALTAAPRAAPAAAREPAHAPAEGALLRAAFPDYDEDSGRLGHAEGVLVGRSSGCVENGPCLLAVAAGDVRPDGAAAPGHAWSTLFAFRLVDGGWVEQGHLAGPAMDASGRWLVGVSVLVDQDGLFVTVTNTTIGGDAGDSTAIHLWSWDGTRFLPVLTAASSKRGASEIESGFALCVDRPGDRPSWELRTREREGRGKWTESKVRVIWGNQAWVERPAERPCGERGSTVNAASAAAAATLRVKSASASKTAAAPKAQPWATAPANAIDGNRQTAWVAGGKKGGVGEWLQVDLAAPSALGSVALVATCPGADWKASPRLKRIRLRFEDGPAQEETLADVPSAQSITVTRKAPAKWVRIELLELYRGTRRQDACVTEVTPQGR
jgi:F5/8 type C domain